MVTNSIPFLITIDTEGDNLWAKPTIITSENSKYLNRFQALCENYQYKPTYLTNYEMAIDENFCKMAREALQKNMCEIGMHLHSWNSPPYYSLTENDNENHPFLVDYPDEIMEQKIMFMTKLLEKQFGEKIYSHRSGRWAMDTRYMNLLEKYGYEVDCSVAPYCKFDVKSEIHKYYDCVDYSGFTCYPYFTNKRDFSTCGDMNILELPVTILSGSTLYDNRYIKYLLSKNIGKQFKRVLRKFKFNDFYWLRPRHNNLAEMKSVVNKVIKNELPYAEFMIHSSELMPGGSPTFKTEQSIELLYKNLEELFKYLKENKFVGMTLKEFRDEYVNKNRLTLQ